MLLPALARRHTTNYRGAVVHGFFCMKGRMLTGETLDDDT
jgi:hypothetical protein